MVNKLTAGHNSRQSRMHNWDVPAEAQDACEPDRASQRAQVRRGEQVVDVRLRGGLHDHQTRRPSRWCTDPWPLELARGGNAARWANLDAACWRLAARTRPTCSDTAQWP